MGCKTLAVITARGGSKRIPGKNIKNFCGKPIIAYSINAALCSGLFDEVMVSTDSEEIAEIARAYGAKTPFMRSKATSGDFASTDDVLFEVFQKYIASGNNLQKACCIYPTAPLITAENIEKGYRLLEREGVHKVYSIVKFSFPPQRAVVINESQMICLLYPENRFVRTQDLSPIYHDCGQFYWYDVPFFLEHNDQITDYCAPVILDELYVQDIDNETDWKIAEMKYELLKRNGML